MKARKNLRNIRLLNRKKTDPGQFLFTGTRPAEKLCIQLFRYDETECREEKDLKPGDIEKFTEGRQKFWLNIYGLSDTEAIADICRKQGIHSLVIQDILDVNQRPKFQEFEEYSFLTIKSTVPKGNEQETEQISFVFGSNFLISFQERVADHFEHLRHRLRENKGFLRERGPDYLLYTMLEAILDNYFKTLQQFYRAVESIDLVGGDSEPSPAVLEQIEKNKKEVHFIRKVIIPVKEFALAVEREDTPFIEKGHVKYFFEIKDLCLTLLDTCDSLLASLESLANLFFSVQSHRMNQVMKTLTIVATIFIPLTFIAGIYGMNFTYMPELDWKYGYAAVWAVFVLIFAGMIAYFRKKKWL